VKIDFENITISLPRPLMRKLRILAAQANQSVSKLLAIQAEGLVSRQTSYKRALREEAKKMEDGLYKVGRRSWKRDALYVRR